MKTLFVVIGVVSVLTIGRGQEFDATTRKAFQLEAKADFVASYGMDEKLDIKIGAIEGIPKVRHAIEFDLSDLESFFDRQRHKDLIVIVLSKHVWTDEKLNAEVQRLKNYFVARAYRRIVIQQGYSTGRGIHLDHKVKGDAADEEGIPNGRDHQILEWWRFLDPKDPRVSKFLEAIADDVNQREKPEPPFEILISTDLADEKMPQSWINGRNVFFGENTTVNLLVSELSKELNLDWSRQGNVMQITRKKDGKASK